MQKYFRVVSVKENGYAMIYIFPEDDTVMKWYSNAMDPKAKCHRRNAKFKQLIPWRTD